MMKPLLGSRPGLVNVRLLGAQERKFSVEFPLLGVKQTEFALRRPTAYSHERTLEYLTRSAAIRPKPTFESPWWRAFLDPDRSFGLDGFTRT